MNPASQGNRLLARLRCRWSPEIVAAALLFLATVAALSWANSPWGNTYTSFWNAELAVRLGGAGLSQSLRHLANAARIGIIAGPSAATAEPGAGPHRNDGPRTFRYEHRACAHF